MDKRKEANLRVKSNITKSLLGLLENKSISEISVSEIIKEAGVARASFYRNYATKESVITTLITDVLDDFRQKMKSDGDDFYTYENVHMSFAFFEQYGNLFLDLHRFGYGSIILDMLNQFHEEVAGTMPNKSVDRYKLYIYMGSLYNTALVWLQNDNKESVDVIADMFYETCVINAKPYSGGKR